MKYRRLGRQGIKVSEVGLGSWLTYGGATEFETAKSCIARAYDLGINFFDTANAYMRGKSEEAVGEILKAYPRESLVLATKVYFPMGDGPNDKGLSRKHIFDQCNASLRRLQVDYIDLYQAHRYDTETPLEETLLAFDDLVNQGKILHWGVSQWGAEQIEAAAEFVHSTALHPMASNQPLYNALERGLEQEVMPACAQHGVGLVVYSPLAQGLLTGKYRPNAQLPEGSRAADPKQNMFLGKGRLDDDVLARIEKLRPIAERKNCTMGQLALAWCLRRPEISSVIIGASRPEQVEENAGASDIGLSADDIREMDAALGFGDAPADGPVTEEPNT